MINAWRFSRLRISLSSCHRPQSQQRTAGFFGMEHRGRKRRETESGGKRREREEATAIENEIDNALLVASVVWFRLGDLRILDHEPLHAAVEETSLRPTTLLPVFCLNDALLRPRSSQLQNDEGVEEKWARKGDVSGDVEDESIGTRKESGYPSQPSSTGGWNGLPGLGPHKAIAIVEAVNDLNKSLKSLKSGIAAFAGDTSLALQGAVIALKRAGYSRVRLHYYSYYAGGFGGNSNVEPMRSLSDSPIEASNRQLEPAQGFNESVGGAQVSIQDEEETMVLKAFEEACIEHSIIGEVYSYWGSTLYHPSDLKDAQKSSYCARVQYGNHASHGSREPCSDQKLQADNVLSRLRIHPSKQSSAAISINESVDEDMDTEKVSDPRSRNGDAGWGKQNASSRCLIGSNTSNAGDWSAVLEHVKDVLVSAPHMTSFRGYLQDHVRVRYPLPSPQRLPSLPFEDVDAVVLSGVESLSSNLEKGCYFYEKEGKLRKVRRLDFESFFQPLHEERPGDQSERWSPELSDSICRLSFRLRQLYKDAGAISSLKKMEQISGLKDVCVTASSFYYEHKAACPQEASSDNQIQGGGTARLFGLRRPPCTEMETLQHLNRILGSHHCIRGRGGFCPTTGTGESSTALDGAVEFSRGISTRRSAHRPSEFMQSYHKSRMMAGGIGDSAMISLALSIGSISPRTMYWRVLEDSIARGHICVAGEERSSATSLTASMKTGGLRDEDGLSHPPVEDARATPKSNKPSVADAKVGESMEGLISSSHSNIWKSLKASEDAQGYYHMLLHLIIRDFFIYNAVCDINSQDQKSETDAETAWQYSHEFFRAWAQGQTGFPFIDASMRELIHSGWMDNRCRQNVASFLAKTLCIQWTWGAELMQAFLIDHDERLNVGNWKYVAGLSVIKVMWCSSLS